MKTIKHIIAYVTAGLIASIFMIGFSLFTTLPALNIGLAGLMIVWLPLYGLLAMKLTEVE